MNMIAIFLFISLFILTVVFSVRLQTLIFNSLELAGIIAQGVWNRAAGASLTIIGILQMILTAGWIAARFTTITLAILWGLNVLLFWSMGLYGNAGWCGFILGLIIPVWSMLYILHKIPTIGPATKIFWKASSVIIIVTFVPFVFGLWSPEVKKSYDAWSESKKRILAGFFYKGALKSVSRSEVVGELAEYSVVYDENRKEVWKYHKGTPVKSVEPGAKPEEDGMVKVMLTNQCGDFARGNNIVYIPGRKIIWKDA